MRCRGWKCKNMANYVVYEIAIDKISIGDWCTCGKIKQSVRSNDIVNNTGSGNIAGDTDSDTNSTDDTGSNDSIISNDIITDNTDDNTDISADNDDIDNTDSGDSNNITDDDTSSNYSDYFNTIDNIDSIIDNMYSTYIAIHLHLYNSNADHAIHYKRFYKV
jgi:hypothetical protein